MVLGILIITTNININVVRNQINEDVYFLHFTDRSNQICEKQMLIFSKFLFVRVLLIAT